MASAQEVVKRGYLTKSPPARQALAKWKRRWCMLLDSHLVYPFAPRYVRLEYFEDEEAHMAGKDPKGVIDLKDCQQVKRSSNVKNHKNVFDIVTTERVYHMSADSAAEKQEWVEALYGILSNEDEAFTSKGHHTRQIAPGAAASSLSPRRYQRSTARSVSPVVNRRAVESQSQSYAPNYASTRPSGNNYSPGPISYNRARRSISERVKMAIEKEKEATNQTEHWQSAKSSSSSDERPRCQTVSLQSPSPSSTVATSKRLHRTQSAHLGPMGDYDTANPRQDSDSDEETFAGPVSIRPQESAQKQQTLERQCLSPTIRQVPPDDSESEDEASGPTSIASQGSAQVDPSDPLAQAYVPSTSAVAKRFSLHADIDLSERNPDYHNLSYPEDAPGNHGDYKNIVFPDAHDSSHGGKARNYKNLVYPDSSQDHTTGSKVEGVHDYTNLAFSDTPFPAGTGNGHIKKHDYQNMQYPGVSGSSQSPRVSFKNIGPGSEDFQMMNYPNKGSKSEETQEDQYDKLPSHSHLSHVAATMNYSSVGNETRRVDTPRGPVASPRHLPKVKMTGHSDYDFAAPRVGMSAGSAKQPVEDANYESAAPHHGTFAGIMKHPAEHPDYDFAAPHVSTASRVSQYNYVQPKPRKPNDENYTKPVQRHVQYDYVQPKPRPRKEGIASGPESAVLSMNDSKPHGQKANYDYVVPGARIASSQTSIQEWKSTNFSDYYEAAPRQSTKAVVPEADGNYHFVPEAAPPQVEADDYDKVGFHERHQRPHMS